MESYELSDRLSADETLYRWAGEFLPSVEHLVCRRRSRANAVLTDGEEVARHRRSS
jgi:hypothetical protein